ncbi:hypothetical protein BYT27DRAFT_7198371 [Phlegmacium glaucopus]|nr:hypothetical protein BYT27DRAFT_7198371 [Phlegmacium glaucopus]
MSFILTGLSTNISSKETTYCAIVAAILGHLSFFLHNESPQRVTHTLERAVQIYQQSTCDTSVKEAVEKIFEPENSNKGSYAFSNLFKAFNVNYELLAEEAVQIATNNLILLIGDYSKEIS